MDILLDEKVNVMLAISGKITSEHETKLTNQLKLSEIEVGFLLNIYVERKFTPVFASIVMLIEYSEHFRQKV